MSILNTQLLVGYTTFRSRTSDTFRSRAQCICVYTKYPITGRVRLSEVLYLMLPRVEHFFAVLDTNRTGLYLTNQRFTLVTDKHLSPVLQQEHTCLVLIFD